MMLISLLIIWATLLFLSKSLSLKLFPPWTSNVRLVSCWSWKERTPFPISISSIIRTFGYCLTALFPQRLSINTSNNTSVCKMGDAQGTCHMSILDLPNLVLECILEKQTPEELCRIASVCIELRDICLSDHLWERHLRRKWGRVIDSSSRQASLWHKAMQNSSVVYGREKPKGLLGLLLHLSPFSWIHSEYEFSDKKICSTTTTSLVSWYSLLESGKLWFPAQVYNRENGHAGFMLSCYDAELNYDRLTDTFKARYPPHGRRALVVENGVNWDKIRTPPVDTSPHELYISDCLDDLHPGDHVEIQWRRNTEFPYGWWYGIVGHLESCDGNERFCRCHKSDAVVLDFNQYAPGSRWRHTLINRKYHMEEGNEAYGFYGGIRKITSNDEILTWKQLWPTEVLE